MPEPSDTLGRYHLLGRLGTGGMATVYRGFQPALGRTVAIKLIRPAFTEEPDFVERFRQEAMAVARLRHPNIVQVFDFDEVDGKHFIVMEHLEGETLRSRLKRVSDLGERLPREDALRIVSEVAAGLTYAHGLGILHRDVKPANVMLTPGGAVLTDFGISKLLAASDQLTRTGMGVGTPEYMSPEQARGQANDPRSDVYSLGVIAYEMFTGRVPFTGESGVEILVAQATQPLPPPSEIDPSVGAATEAVLIRALSKEPQDRYASATEFAQALSDAVAVDARGPEKRSTVKRIAAIAQDERVKTAAAVSGTLRNIIALVVTLVGIGGGVFAAQSRNATDAPIAPAAALARGSGQPATRSGAGGGPFAALKGALVYSPKLEQASTGQPGEVFVPPGPPVRISGGELEITAPPSPGQSEAIFQAGQLALARYVAEMQVTLSPGSTMRFAFCPRSDRPAAQGQPPPSYCVTFLTRGTDPNRTIELRYATGEAGAFDRIGDPVVVPAAPSFRLAVAVDRSTFRVAVDDVEVLQRTDARLTTGSVPPLVQAGRLTTNPNDGGAVRIRDVRIYALR